MDTQTDRQYPALASGQTLGPDHHRFQLNEPIGPHPFGELWQARDLNTTPSATVSLLILDPLLARDTAFVNAFKKQQSLCKSLKHRHLVEYYGYFLDRSGLLFSAHEALDSLSLTQLLASRRGRKLPMPQKRALLGQLALALDAGYQKLRLPHGCLSPDLVFINRRDGVKLLGFAGADCFRAAARLLPGLQEAQAPYGAPETGARGHPGASADLYSLALLAHELLSGSKAWTVPPSDPDPQRLSRPSKITAPQWALICQALAPDPVSRPAGAGAWVRKLFSDEPELPRNDPGSEAGDSDSTSASPAEAERSGLLQRLKKATATSRDSIRLTGWLTPGRLRGAGLFVTGLALGIWLGLWLGQRQLDAIRAQLLEVAQQGAELKTALEALQAERDAAESGAPVTAQPPDETAEAESHGDSTGMTATPEAFRDELQGGGFGPEMVPLPTGTFLMGSESKLADDNERPVHRIELSRGVALARHEVTFEQYDRFADASGRGRPDDNGWGRGSQPVINVSWHDARAYARWLADETGQPYRLPTEAEWEYAARAGTQAPYWWGDALGRGHAVCDECGTDWDGRQPAPVGRLAANPWGLHDLNGNVDEWVQDCYYDSHAGAPTDGSARVDGDCEFRVMRGGSWFDIGRLVRASSRYRHPPDSRRTSWGFRVAVDLPPRN